MEMSCNTNQFKELALYGPRMEPHGVRGLVNISIYYLTQN